MSRQPEEITVDTEQCSTNYYASFGETEIFNCQITVRGNPTKEQLAAHIASAKDSMRLVLAAGGHAKAAGREATAQTSGNAPSSQYEFYKGAKGKTFIKLNGAAEPNEITCPIHNAKMKRRTNDEGSWYSHKAPDDKWCSVTVPGKSE